MFYVAYVQYLRYAYVIYWMASTCTIFVFYNHIFSSISLNYKKKFQMPIIYLVKEEIFLKLLTCIMDFIFMLHMKEGI